MTDPLRVLIVDDEDAARRGLRRLVEARDGVRVAGEAGSGEAARTAIRELDPDIVLLDVRMPGETGIEALRSMPAEEVPAVVLVTAYDDHALEAFDVEAVDYLLKPYSDAEFDRAMDRAERRARRNLAETTSRVLIDALRELSAEDLPSGPAEAERIHVRVGRKVRLLDPASIRWVEADGDYVRLHTEDGEHLLRSTMTEIAERLESGGFVRIHRSTLVRLDVVREIRPRGPGRYAVVLDDETQRNVSRRGYERLQRALGLG